MVWTEGDRLIVVTYQWIAEKHRAAGSPLFVTHECCRRLEDAVEATYQTHDAERMKVALRTFGRHWQDHFEAATARRREEALA